LVQAKAKGSKRRCDIRRLRTAGLLRVRRGAKRDARRAA